MAKRIKPQDLEIIKKVLESEYHNTLGFMSEDPMFVASVLYMRDTVAGCTLENAVRKMLPKPCPKCRFDDLGQDTDHECDFRKIVNRCALRVTALRMKLR